MLPFNAPQANFRAKETTMFQLRGVCIVLSAGLMMAAPYTALAQAQSRQSDSRAAPQAGDVHNIRGGVTVVRFHQSHSDVRIADHYARADDRRADDAWKRGDRKAACQWATAAQDDAGLHRANYAYKVDEYCG
jgi:hypothetical protein